MTEQNALLDHALEGLEQALDTGLEEALAVVGERECPAVEYCEMVALLFGVATGHLTISCVYATLLRWQKGVRNHWGVLDSSMSYGYLQTGFVDLWKDCAIPGSTEATP